MSSTNRKSETTPPDPLREAVNRAIGAVDCQRLAEWVLIGPVQRAEVESFADRLMAAERERLRALLMAHLDQHAVSHHVTLAECHAARYALQLVMDELGYD